MKFLETVLTSKLLGSNTMDELLISNSVNENNRNMSLSQNLENSLVKYSRDELLEIRKTVRQDFTLRQINVKTLKVIRKYRMNRTGQRSVTRKIRLKQHQLEVNECNLRTCMV